MTDKETAMKELLALYKDYCLELDQYDDETYPAGQDEKVFRQYQQDEHTTIKHIAVDGQTAGFLIVINPHGSTRELIIAEAYIKPEYRNKGWMAWAVQDTMTDSYTLVRMMTFNRNVKALPYWTRILGQYGFTLAASEKYNDCLTEYFFARGVQC